VRGFRHPGHRRQRVVLQREPDRRGGPHADGRDGRLLRRAEDRVPSHFRATGDRIVIVGGTDGALGGSAYWAELCDFTGGEAPKVDLEHESRLQRFLVAAAAARLLRSAHDCSEGGLAVALAEAAIGGPYAERGFGAIVDFTPTLRTSPP
jgi:phosphoribosylformylglycinamidine synthase